MEAAEINPHHRIVIASAEAEETRLQLPLALNIARWLLAAALIALAFFFISISTVEAKVTYLLALTLALLNPVWGIYAIALMGPLFLLDQAKTHMLCMLEVVTIGMIAAELRLLDRPYAHLPRIDPFREKSGPPPRADWSGWPYFLTGLALLLLASSLTGLQHIYLEAQQPQEAVTRFFVLLDWMFYGPALEYEWTLRSLWNWVTGMVVAIVAARRLDTLSTARFLKLGGVSLLVSCLLALFSWSDFLSLTDIRRTNPDPLQQGRLQGLAGHPGWFGQWIVLMWTGFLLWWSPGRTKRNALIAGSLALILLALVLTAARAAWLGVGVAGAAGVWLLLRSFPAIRAYLPIAIPAAVVVLIAGVLIGGDVLQQRLINLLRAQDRVNYYISGLILLSDYPFGVGLGNHFRYYEWTFSPFWRYYQNDHITAHSLWLHTLIENGPIFLAALVGGVAAFAWEAWRALPRFDSDRLPIMIALVLGLLGILTVSFFQYIAYIRVVELTAWIMAGAAIGHFRREAAPLPPGEVQETAIGRRILLICGVGAIVTASFNAGRNDAGKLPWLMEKQRDGLGFWTNTQWRTPVSRDIETIEFELYRRALPAEVTIRWPDGKTEHLTLEPESSRRFSRDFEPAEPEPLSEPRWLVIEAFPLWTPAKHLEDSADDRGLGVYVGTFMMWRPGDDREAFRANQRKE